MFPAFIVDYAGKEKEAATITGSLNLEEVDGIRTKAMKNGKRVRKLLQLWFFHEWMVPEAIVGWRTLAKNWGCLLVPFLLTEFRVCNDVCKYC